MAFGCRYPINDDHEQGWMTVSRNFAEDTWRDSCSRCLRLALSQYHSTSIHDPLQTLSFPSSEDLPRSHLNHRILRQHISRLSLGTMSKRKRSIGGDDCSSDIESPGPYKSFEINLKHALPWDPAKMDALMKDPRYRSQPTYSFYRTKFERCDVEIRCPAGLRVGNQCFYVESKMFQPYPRFWTYLMKNRVVRATTFTSTTSHC